MPLNDALGVYGTACLKYDERVNICLQELLEECPYKGLPVLLGRNPTIQHGAIQLVYVVRIKTDIDDDTISLSPAILDPPNADHDGDAMYGLSLKEMAEVSKFEGLHPSMVMLSNDRVSLSNQIGLSEQSVLALHTWLNN